MPIWLGSPSGNGIGIPGLVDSGADITVVQASLIEQMGLPMVGIARVRGFGGNTHAAPLHAAQVQIETVSVRLPVLAFGEETILGRDLLNNLVFRFDGPRRRLDTSAS